MDTHMCTCNTHIYTDARTIEMAANVSRCAQMNGYTCVNLAHTYTDTRTVGTVVNECGAHLDASMCSLDPMVAGCFSVLQGVAECCRMRHTATCLHSFIRPLAVCQWLTHRTI